jgi:hypothetical protein
LWVSGCGHSPEDGSAHGGEAGLYAASTVVFVGLAGLLMHLLVRGHSRLLRFYGIFISAFIAYAVVVVLVLVFAAIRSG